jgi:hypothetical protein
MNNVEYEEEESTSKSKVFASIGILLILVVIFYLITNTITQTTGYLISEESFEDNKNFLKCLNEKEIFLFINSVKLEATLEEIQNKAYLGSVSVFNCATDNLFCVEKGVGDFPTWIIEENRVENDIDIYELSELTGCYLG